MNADTLARLRLLSLDDMGPSRLAWLLDGREAPEVVGALLAGRLPHDLGEPPPGLHRHTLDAWCHRIRDIDIDPVLAAHRRLGIRTVSPLDVDWPFAHDPEPPGLLFALGDLGLLDASARVAVVGTRRCTSVGRTVAGRLGADVARAGGVVVSGLALGVDGAAHRGALDQGPDVIGVVGSGLDVIYPRANGSLWHEVGRRGLLVSEWPAGSRPKPWRFPARNRLIAALSEAIVVVESHERGGALSTADEGIRRDRPVMAIPGSVLSPASAGTNALLVDGAIPVRDAADVLAFLGHPIDRLMAVGPTDRPMAAGASGSTRRGQAASRPRSAPGDGPAGVAERVLVEVTTGPRHLDELVAATGLTVADVIGVVQELQGRGLVHLDGSTVSFVDPGR